VIVDNASSDDSYDFLASNFINNDKIHVIQTASNLGFARGNNFGYDYIQNNLEDVDYLHCINSDILFDDLDGLINRISDDHDSYIIGPNVIHNDLRTSPLQVRDINSIKKANALDARMYRNKVLKHRFGKLLGKFYYNYMEKNNSFIQIEHFPHYEHQLSADEYYVLNGCYLVFTRLYLNTYDVLFDPSTFLYCEEEILFYRMKQANHQVSYYDDVKIIHLEGVSSVDSIIFKYQQLKKSSEAFKKILGGE
jgi:GT2 family glycosyltransferase